MKLKIKINNTYAGGEEFEHIKDVDVEDAPDVARDHPEMDDWGLDCLMEFTGEGPQYANSHAIYEVKILEAPTRPDLVGFEVSAEG